MELDPYKELGVKVDADFNEIKKFYRKLVLKYHPDKVRNPSEKPRAADIFNRIQLSYDVLADDRKRALYDVAVKSGCVVHIQPGGGVKVLRGVTGSWESKRQTDSAKERRASYHHSGPAEVDNTISYVETRKADNLRARERRRQRSASDITNDATTTYIRRHEKQDSKETARYSRRTISSTRSEEDLSSQKASVGLS
jgi:curved DNA-binding protein CbpA